MMPTCANLCQLSSTFSYVQLLPLETFGHAYLGYTLALIYDDMACPLMTGETKSRHSRRSIFLCRFCSSVTRLAMSALVLVTGCGKFLG
jgi:hypothetical protein